MSIYQWNNNEIPNYLAPWKKFTLNCMKYLKVWTSESLKQFMADHINDPNFYNGSGQKSTKNIRKYWDLVHQNSCHRIPNINSYYTVIA